MLIDNKNVEITNTYFYTHGLWRSHVYRRGEMLKNDPIQPDLTNTALT